MKNLPIKGGNGRWLAPCSPARARQLIKSGKAVKRHSDDVGHYLQLTVTVAAAELPKDTREWGGRA